MTKGLQLVVAQHNEPLMILDIVDIVNCNNISCINFSKLSGSMPSNCDYKIRKSMSFSKSPIINIEIENTFSFYISSIRFFKMQIKFITLLLIYLQRALNFVPSLACHSNIWPSGHLKQKVIHFKIRQFRPCICICNFCISCCCQYFLVKEA